MRFIFVLALFQVLRCDSLQGQLAVPRSRVGSISGIVTGSDGSAINGATVGLWLLPPHPRDKFLKTQQLATSLSDGSFSFNGLIEGDYRICVHSAGTAWLNPCEWGPQSPPVTISKLQTSVKNPIILKLGVFVSIRVEDPSQLLDRHETKTAGAHLLIGVTNDANAFVPARVLSRDLGGRGQQILIPYDTVKTLSVYSSLFRLSDQADVPVAGNGILIPVTVASGASPSPIRIKITGISK